MDERDLVIRAKEGDVDAFCILYDKYKKKLYTYAYYKLGNNEDAEDVVQDCMLTAYKKINGLKKPESFSSWIYTILYHGCMSAIKDKIK